MTDGTPVGQIENQGIPKGDPTIAKVAKIVGGAADTERGRWAADNITSIRQAVQGGKHTSLYYPASGRDILRPLVAYDADELIVVEPDMQRQQEAKRQLEEIGVEPEVVVNGNKTTTTFTLDGRQRRIIEIQDDARYVKTGDLGYPTVDVLTIHLPTGADQPVRADDIYFQQKYGDDWYEKKYDSEAKTAMEADPDAPKRGANGYYDVVIEGVTNNLTQTNYNLVNEGGFFDFGEKSLQHGESVPALCAIAGLVEKPITKRHPHTVLTSMYPKPEEIKKRGEKGYIYQKQRIVPTQIIEAFSDVVSTQFWTEYNFGLLERGDFEFFERDLGEGASIAEGIQHTYAEFKDQVGEYVHQFEGFGIGTSLINKFRGEMLASYKKRALKVQKDFQELIDKSIKTREQFTKGEITQDVALEQMGIDIEFDAEGNMRRVKNNKWPLASKFMLRKTEEDEAIVAKVKEFVDADLVFD